MTDVTQTLSKIEQGDESAAADLLPLVYEELRKLAASKLSGEKPGQTLQPTALVHEAYAHLVRQRDGPWNGRGHFFAAAAEAMRRILVDTARSKNSLRRGRGQRRHALSSVELAEADSGVDMLVLSEAVNRLEREHPQAAEVDAIRQEC